MKGILKIYHPEETLKYNIKSSYCKAIYNNKQHNLEVEITTDDSLDHVEDDSLQYSFPQLSFKIFDFPIEEQLEGQILEIKDTEDETYTEVELFDNEEAYLYDNHLSFSRNEDQELQLVWKGTINDFYTNSDTPIDFKLKCHFKPDAFNSEEDEE